MPIKLFKTKKKFVCALEEFRKLESLPVSIDVSLLDDGSGNEADTLSRNKAAFWKSST